MGELLDTFNRRILKKKEKVSIPAMTVVQVRNTISKLCREHLQDPADILEFDVPQRLLPAVVEALNDSKITNSYEFSQASASTFLARIRSEELI